jgi:hypothetical protein
MSRHVTTIRFAVLAIPFALGALSVPAGAESILALEPARVLEEAADDAVVTTPAVALRPDGGVIGVWADFTDGEVSGRWYGPVDDLSEPENGTFTLVPESDARGGVALARGEGDRYLAVWQGPFDVGALSARVFDGQGVSLHPVRAVAGSSLAPPAVAGRPGGGYVLAWWERIDETAHLRYRFLAADGTPLGAVSVVEAPPGANSLGARVAVDPEGVFTVSWSWQDGLEEESGLWARSFLPGGSSAGPIAELAAMTDSSQFIEHDLASVGAGELLVVWTDGIAPSTVVLRSRHFHPDGSVGASQRIDVSEEEPFHFVSRPALAGAPDGDAVASWYEEELSVGRVRARLLETDGSPRSDPFTVDSWTDSQDFANGTDVDRDAEGRVAVAWGRGFIPPILPPESVFYRSAWERRFRETDEACHPVLTLDFTTAPAEPTADDSVRLLFEGLADCAELSVTDWTFDPATGFRVEAEAVSGGCGTFPPFPFSLPVEVGMLAAGDYPVAIDVALPGGGTCGREFGFTVAPGDPTGSPPPPDVPPLTSDALPGFDVWVMISAGGVPVVGSKEPACIPETLCVSGRLPGRSEVFVRVIGPRPNGRLWPTLVKFTTSQVEVWIEQVATGEVEYYVLEEARPGFDELPGLFDREGFEP